MTMEVENLIGSNEFDKVYLRTKDKMKLKQRVLTTAELRRIEVITSDSPLMGILENPEPLVPLRSL